MLASPLYERVYNGNTMKINKIGIAAIFLGMALSTGAVAYSIQSPVVHKVAIEADRIKPGAIFVKVGQYVQLESKDGKSHDIALGTGAAHGAVHDHKRGSSGSGRFSADEAYKVQFNEEGVYTLHDHDNPELSLTVVASK